MERSEGCGFDPTVPADAAGLIRQWAATYRSILISSPGQQLRARQADGVWTPIEYAAHVRDVFALFERRVRDVVDRPGTALEIIDHDAAVTAGGYNRLDPDRLADELLGCAERLAGTLERIREEQWQLYGLRGGERRTLAEIAQRAVHEAQHHLRDIQYQLAGQELGPTRGGAR